MRRKPLSRSSSAFKFKSLPQDWTRVLLKKMTSDPTEDSWQCYYSPAAISTRKTATVSKKRPMIVVRRFLRCLRVYEMWLGVAAWRDNSHMHLLLEYKVYKPVSILLSHFISWQTTTSLATGNSCLHTLWKKRRMQAPVMMLMSVKRCQGCKRQETTFLCEVLHSWNGN